MALYIVYQLLVLTNLLYLTRFWGGATSSHLNSLESIQGCCFTWCTHLVKPLTIITCLSLVLEELEALWLGVIQWSHRWSLMCMNHIDMITHPSLFTKLGTTCMYVECSTAGPSHVSLYEAMPAGWSPIHVLTRLMIAQLQWSSIRHLHLLCVST